MAGDWSNVAHWKDNLKCRVQSSDSISIDSIGEHIRESAEHFMKSVFCQVGSVYQLLLSGFPNGSPTILSASLYPLKRGHSLTVTPSESFASIGSWSTIANALLTSREYHPRMTLEYASYLVYEAKRCSERNGTVGRMTTLVVHRLGGNETIDEASVLFFSLEGQAQIESYYSDIWKVPFIEFPDFPPRFFMS